MRLVFGESRFGPLSLQGFCAARVREQGKLASRASPTPALLPPRFSLLMRLCSILSPWPRGAKQPVTLPKVSIAKRELSGRSHQQLSSRPLWRGTPCSSSWNSGCRRSLAGPEVFLSTPKVSLRPCPWNGSVGRVLVGPCKVGDSSKLPPPFWVNPLRQCSCLEQRRLSQAPSKAPFSPPLLEEATLFQPSALDFGACLGNNVQTCN